MKKMGRVLDLSAPWVCPPSLRKVFAARHARQELRQAKGRVQRALRELREAQEAVERLKEEG